MAIYLGNESTKQMIARLGIKITQEEEEKLESMRQDYADVDKDKWHCFDIPFVIICGSQEVSDKLFEILEPYSEEMKAKIMIGVKNE